AQQHASRNRQADLFRGLQIDHEVELRWLLDGKMTRFLNKFLTHKARETKIKTNKKTRPARDRSGLRDAQKEVNDLSGTWPAKIDYLIEQALGYCQPLFVPLSGPSNCASAVPTLEKNDELG